jgi:hypothetical protein
MTDESDVELSLGTSPAHANSTFPLRFLTSAGMESNGKT